MAYIFFTTGFEYKMSHGIESFGGYGECEYENGNHHWTAEDLPIVLYTIRKMEKQYSISPTAFEKYSLDYYGTTALRWDLFFLEIDEIIKDKYILGCIIYHQLLYHCPLSADYMI
jgi:hypothetical protein